MPSIKEMTTKDGKRFYKIRVSRGRGKSYLSTRWYPPEGWSCKAIERELAKQAAAFERKAQAGEVISREEQAEIERQQAIEAAKIKTLKQYGEGVFMPAKAITMSENGRTAYQGMLDHWIYPALGELKLRTSPPPKSEPCCCPCKRRARPRGLALSVTRCSSPCLKRLTLPI